jgi:hypothetical protein
MGQGEGNLGGGIFLNCKRYRATSRGYERDRHGDGDMLPLIDEQHEAWADGAISSQRVRPVVFPPFAYAPCLVPERLLAWCARLPACLLRAAGCGLQ